MFYIWRLLITMSSLIETNVATARDIWFDDSKMIVLLSDGREIAVPIDWLPKLRDCTDAERNNWRFIGNGQGMHWPDLDEDVPVAGLLRG